MLKRFIGLLILVFVVVSITVTVTKTYSSDADSESHKKVETLGKTEPNTAKETSAKVNEGIKIGDRAPDFRLTTIKGQDVKLSDYRGTKVILNFWATWCPPCNQEMPDMQKFYGNTSRDDVEILAVNITSQEQGTDVVKKFIKDHDITFPVLLDKQSQVDMAYKAQTIPTSYMIDSQGIIRQKKIGPMTEAWMEEQINSFK